MPIFDERAFIARVEAADADELAGLLRRPTGEQEKALRVHLGTERYRRLRSMVLARGVTRGKAATKGNVVVIPGLMGSELKAFSSEDQGRQIWPSVSYLAAGQLDQLRLADDGRSDYDDSYEVRATGILKRHYGDLLLALSQDWNVRAFWYDWRKDVKLAAAELEAQISGWFDEDAPVHLVAHGMGGLVARTFIKNNAERWEAMWDAAGDGARGGRLIMIGVPNHGSLLIPQLLTGTEHLLEKLALLGCSVEAFQTALRSFAGLYQLLPSPYADEAMEPLYLAETYGDRGISQRHLDLARRHHQALREVVDPARMVVVAGTGQPTWCGIKALKRLDKLDGYELSLEGDSVTTHAAAALAGKDGAAVPIYFALQQNGDLVSNRKVQTALGELLATGATSALPAAPPPPRKLRGRRPKLDQESLQAQLAAEHNHDEEHVQTLARRAIRGEAQPALSDEERKLEELILRRYLSAIGEERHAERIAMPFGPARIEIALVHGGIDSVDYQALKSSKGLAVDAIAVGHYVGEKPAAAELALDRAISRVLPGKVKDKDPDLPEGQTLADELPEADLLLTQYAERGTIRGDLGHLFLLPDPRAHDGERVLAIAGMGMPGRFGTPELTVLARELSWALGRLGKRHLATVLIGSGKGNLSEREAITAWVRGIKNALTGSIEDEQRQLVRLTFIEIDPRKVEVIDDAIRTEQAAMAERNRLQIDYTPLTPDQVAALRREALEWERRSWERTWERQQQQRELSQRPLPVPGKNPVPTRLTLGLERKTYRFGAITESASIPEREIPLDPSLVVKANDELAAETDPELQLERGQFMERLLIPDDLRTQLYTDAPLVLMLDSTTARIHWELLAQSDLETPLEHADHDQDGFEHARYFLGTSRGLTRQLRTTFATPPEPPPPPRRLLRVLVIADPAEDAPLPGAEEEGVEVGDLFESFNTVYEGRSENMVEVVRLFGPREATRTNVLRHLMLRAYDVLHFAGHCVYDKDDIFSSGWIFTGGERLTANELKRIDRIPKFIFSNACESGVTPNRSDLRSVELAPTFAEAFFARGVSNFVCTAWPIDDAAARVFARRLYSGLLGLVVDGSPEPMYVAMREARLAVAQTPSGTLTWGAYQHYGNPFMRLFNPLTMCLPSERPGKTAGLLDDDE